jgi:hypothetical protein
MVGTVDVDKSTVNILISIGNKNCLQNHFPSSGFKQEGRCLDDSESGFQCTPHPFMARLPQGKPAGSSPFQLGFLVFVPRLSSFGLENSLIQMMNRVAAVSLTLNCFQLFHTKLPKPRNNFQKPRLVPPEVLRGPQTGTLHKS